MIGCKWIGFVVIVVIVEIFSCGESEAAELRKQPPSTKDPKSKPADFEKDLKTRVRSAPRNRIRIAKNEAVKRLQANLIKVFDAIATSNQPDVSDNAKAAAKTALSLTKSGKLNGPLVAALPEILESTPSGLEKNPALQTHTIIDQMVQNQKAPGQVGGSSVKLPLQGMLEALSGNLNGVNSLLGKTIGGSPDLLNGVVKSFVGTLGGATEALNFSVGGVGPLLGGLLSGVGG